MAQKTGLGNKRGNKTSTGKDPVRAKMQRYRALGDKMERDLLKQGRRNKRGK